VPGQIADSRQAEDDDASDREAIAGRYRLAQAAPGDAVAQRDVKDPGGAGSETRIEDRVPGGEEALERRHVVVRPAVKEEAAGQPGADQRGDSVAAAMPSDDRAGVGVVSRFLYHLAALAEIIRGQFRIGRGDRSPPP